MGEFFATMGTPCTRSRGEEMGQFFATKGVRLRKTDEELCQEQEQARGESAGPQTLNPEP